MGIGEILRGYFGDQQQKAVALEWGQKWAELTGKTYTASHLASSLSRLMKNDPVGIRFFFLTPEKGEPLFDLLDVPHDQRRHIRKMANELLVPVEQQPARLLVNITPWHGTRDELDQVFRAVESVVLREHGLFPAVIVLTEEQYRALPRTFDDWKARVRICRVTPEEADSVLEDEAGVEGLVLSPTRFPDYSRWAAIAVRSGSLVLEPPDALESLDKGGRLVLVGVGGGDYQLSLAGLIFRPRSIIGTITGSRQELREVIALAQSGKFAPPPVTRMPKACANEALDRLKEGKVIGRLVLEEEAP